MKRFINLTFITKLVSYEQYMKKILICCLNRIALENFKQKYKSYFSDDGELHIYQKWHLRITLMNIFIFFYYEMERFCEMAYCASVLKINIFKEIDICLNSVILNNFVQYFKKCISSF